MVNEKYLFKLEVDEAEEKLYLCVYNTTGTLIDRSSFVYLDTIYNHLTLKLNKMAIVYASKKTIDDEKYYQYYKIDIYELKGVKTFLTLLKDGIIDVSIISRISKSGNDAGRYRNKNLVFNIKKEYIDKLFNKIYSCDCDKNSFLI